MECQKNGKIPPKLMLTQQTFDTYIFQFPYLLQTECLVDKWHNQCMNIWWCTNTFGRAVYILFRAVVPKWGRITPGEEFGLFRGEKKKKGTMWTTGNEGYNVDNWNIFTI